MNSVLTHAAAEMLRQPANRPRPSVGPIAASTWFSGCGIMPSTLPRSLRMPAMALVAPLTFQSGSSAAVGRGVAEQHPALAFEPRDGRFVGDVVAFAVRHRHADHLAGVVAARERRVGALDPQIDVAADEFQRGVAHQHAGQEPASQRIWKPLQTPSTSPPLLGVGAHRIHDRRARRDRAAAQIVAVGEAARHHHEIGARRQRSCRRATPSPARGRR